MRESDKHLAIRARAGTGKTTLLVALAHETSSRETIGAYAFNRSIREELTRRMPPHVGVNTLHGLGYAAIQRAWGRLAIDGNRQRSLAQRVVPESKAYAKRNVVGTVCHLVQLSMHRLAITGDAVAETMLTYGVLPEKGLKPELYVDWALQVLALSRQQTKAISYDDMVFLPAIENLRTGANHASLFDEAQDGTPAEIRVIRNSIRAKGKVVFVGDDRQGIYWWRGGDASAFDDLVATLEADVLPLTWTFRCPVRVVYLANRLVPDLEAAPGAQRGQVTWDSEQAFYANVQPGDAVISRSNAALTRMSMRLLKKGVRVKLAGRDFSLTLKNIISQAETNSVPRFLEWLSPWVTQETERLAAAGKDDKAEEVVDAAEALRELSSGMGSTAALAQKLDALFDDTPGTDYVWGTTVHRAKGLQWHRVWVLESTFRITNREGQNLYYVAITRVHGTSRRLGELHLVQTARSDGKIPPSIARGLLPEDIEAQWEEEDRADETYEGMEEA